VKKNEKLDVGKKIELICGKAKITLKSGGNIDIEGSKANIKMSGAIKVKGSKIDLN